MQLKRTGWWEWREGRLAMCCFVEAHSALLHVCQQLGHQPARFHEHAALVLLHIAPHIPEVNDYVAHTHPPASSHSTAVRARPPPPGSGARTPRRGYTALCSPGEPPVAIRLHSS